MGFLFKSKKRKEREEQERRSIRQNEKIKNLLNLIENQIMSEDGNIRKAFRTVPDGGIAITANCDGVISTIKDGSATGRTTMFDYRKNEMELMTAIQADEFNKMIQERLETIPIIRRVNSYSYFYKLNLKSW